MKIRLLVVLLVLLLRLLPGMIRVFQFQENQWVKVIGEVVKIEQKETKCTATIGMFLVDFEQKCGPLMGDNVAVIGRIQSSVLDKIIGNIYIQPSSFYIDSRPKERSKKEDGVILGWGDNWRRKMAELVNKYVPEPEAGLINGVVLGEKRGLSGEWYQRMIDSGTVHVIVASGYNVMLVGGIVLGISFARFRRVWATFIAIGGMVVYGLITGGDPPVIRAVIMGSLIMFSQVFGRKNSWWWSLLLAGAVMVLIDPRVLTSISFQLTMAASVGIMGLEPVIQKWLSRIGERVGSVRFISRTEFSGTLAAQILTLPLIWWHFGRISLLGLFSNVLVLPLIPTVMLFGGLTIVFGLVFPLITPIIAGFAYVPSFLVMRLIWLMSG